MHKSIKKTPKYIEIMNTLRSEIDNKKWAPGEQIPSDANLFKFFQANRLTVIRALDGLVQEGLIIRKHGKGTYVSDSTPPLIPGKNLTLCILCPIEIGPASFNNKFIGSIIKGILKEWGAEKCTPTFPLNNSSESSIALFNQEKRGLKLFCIGSPWNKKLKTPYLKDIEAIKPDGIISIGIIESEWNNKLIKLKIPTVLVDYPERECINKADIIFADPQVGYSDCVEYFVKKKLKRIHFLGAMIGPSANVTAKNERSWREFVKNNRRLDPDSYIRMGAWRQAMTEQGLECPDTFVHYETFNPIHLESLALTWLDLPKNERPEAILCHSIIQGEVLSSIFKKAGQNLESAGATHIAQKGKAIPIFVEAEQMGAVAADVLLARIKEPLRNFLRIGVIMQFKK